MACGLDLGANCGVLRGRTAGGEALARPKDTPSPPAQLRSLADWFWQGTIRGQGPRRAEPELRYPRMVRKSPTRAPEVGEQGRGSFGF